MRRVVGGAVVVALCVVLILAFDAPAGQLPPVDFAVYRYGAEAAARGVDVYQQNLHGPWIAPEGLPFTYTPFAALVLWPTTLLAPYTAYLVWSIVNVIALAYVLSRYLRGSWYQQLGVLIVALVLARISFVLVHHILFGQVNLLLMALCVFDVFRDPNSRVARVLPRGVLIGLAGAIKLTPMIFVAYFVLARRWRDAAFTIAGFVAAQALAWAVYPTATRTFYTDTVWHLSDKVDLGTSFSSAGNNSIVGAMTAIGPGWRPVGTVVALVVGAACLCAAVRVERRRGLGPAALVVGLTATLVSPVSWIHHWVYLLPALVYLACYGGTRIRVFVALVALFMSATGGPITGDVLLHLHLPWLDPVAILTRESLLLLAVAVIVILWRMAPVSPLPPDGEVRAAAGRRLET